MAAVRPLSSASAPRLATGRGRRGCVPHALPADAASVDARASGQSQGQQVTLLTRRQVQQLAAGVLLATATGSSHLVAHAAADPATTQRIQADYDRYASDYDSLDGGTAASSLGFDALRDKLLSKAQGEVVEVAVGTGLNLPRYPWTSGAVSKVLALDLSKGMLDQARARVASRDALRDLPISFQQADATALPLATSSVDTVVDTFSLCVIPDPLAALKEMARIIKPGNGGRVLLLEHSRSDNPLLAGYQDLTASAVATTAKGCVWNQDVVGLLTEAGLKVERMERHVAGTIVLIEAYKV